MINESVHTSDDQDIGDVYAVNRYFLVVKRGLVNVHYYYIPISRVEGWDGRVLWLNVTEDLVKSNYERDRTPESLHPIMSRKILHIPFHYHYRLFL